MGFKKHLETINQAYQTSQSSSDVSFEQFPRLPVELRQYIWRYSMEHHRLIELHIEIPPAVESRRSRRRPRQSRQSQPSPQPQRRYSTKNLLGNLVSGQHEPVVAKSYQLYSKLLRVNRESRAAALRFYRVFFPCHFLAAAETPEIGRRTVNRTLYLNPEYDFIHIVSNVAAQETVNLFHDLKAYDPRNAGVLNLAMGRNFLTRLNMFTEDAEVPARTAFIDTLAGLENIIWVAEGHAGRRIVPHDGFPGDRVRFNHSMPVKATTPSFELLERDPREVGPELTFVQAPCTDPRGWHLDLKRIMARWGIRPVQPPRERVLFACKPTGLSTISSIEGADRWLEDEERGWIECQFRPYFVYHMVKRYEKKEPPVEGPEELAGAVRPAIGFWLFPLSALGNLEDRDLRNSKIVFDMSEHWPQLALSRLS